MAKSKKLATTRTEPLGDFKFSFFNFRTILLISLILSTELSSQMTISTQGDLDMTFDLGNNSFNRAMKYKSFLLRHNDIVVVLIV